MSDKRRARLANKPTVTVDDSLVSATPESLGSLDLLDDPPRPKRPFVSPKRIPRSNFDEPTPSGVSGTPTKRVSPVRKVLRPCSHSTPTPRSQGTSQDGGHNIPRDGGHSTPRDDGNNEVSFDRTPLTSTPVTVRRRVKGQNRSSSNDKAPARGAVDPEELRETSRVRSWSPDGRTCCSPAWDEKTTTQKHQRILAALDALPSPDVTTIRQLAISRGGLIDNSLRKRAWASLLDIDINNIPPKPTMEVFQSHRDYQQVLLDVNRSSKRFPPEESVMTENVVPARLRDSLAQENCSTEMFVISQHCTSMLESIRLSYQDQLIECIMWILVSHEDLHYYQGFHDVVVTFLLVVGEELTFAIMDKLVENHFRDFMYKNMDKTTYMLHYLLPLVGKASPKLRNFLERSEVGSLFCLSWLITWFGHVLGDFKDIVRLYDFFIACHPLMPIYLAADIVLYREDDILACECEMPFVHGLLSRIPEDLPFELLITRTGDLFIQYPPGVLEPEVASQYQQYLDENERRRVAALEQRERLKAAKNQPRPVPSAAKPRRSRRVVKYGILTFLIAASAVAYSLYRNTGGALLSDWLKWFGL